MSLTSDLANISFTDIMRQKNLRVAVKENDIHDFLADQLLPLAKKVYVPQLSPIEEVVKKVLYDHADITFWDHSLISHIADLP